MSQLIPVITADDSAIRDTPVESVCQNLRLEQLLAECEALDLYRRDCPNLYQRVRTLFFLYSIYRFFIPAKLSGTAGKGASISFNANSNLLERRFAEAIDLFLIELLKDGISDGISSALAKAYYQLAIQNLADQVRASVRAVRGNQ